MTDREFRGVFVSADSPLDWDGVSGGDCVVLIIIPDAVFEEYEWVEEGKNHREAMILAAVLNTYGPQTIFNVRGLEASRQQPHSALRIAPELGRSLTLANECQPESESKLQSGDALPRFLQATTESPTGQNGQAGPALDWRSWFFDSRRYLFAA
jgi:hypothetical protein